MMRSLPRWIRPVAAAVGVSAIAVLLVAGGGTSPTPTGAATAPIGASIVVRAANGDAIPAIESHAVALGYSVRRTDAALNAVAIIAPAGVDAAQALSNFALFPGVAYAEPTYTMATMDAPSDSLFPRQAYLATQHAPEAWDVETGNASVIVAVLDSGVDLTHPDLAGRIWTNPAEIAGNGIDDDNNGCVDDVHGCAFVSSDDSSCKGASRGQVDDDAGHGTFVSGIIAANANANGIVGVARGVTIMPVKVVDCLGIGNSLDLAIGMLYAAQNGAHIINISLGTFLDAAILREAARIAHDEFGAMIVAAAGNRGREGVAYPARYDHVMAVGAATSTGTARAPFSSFGPEVDVAAIGIGIIGTVPPESCRRFLPCIGNSPYAQGNGTSFAAPQVAGLAALILSHHPNMTPDAVMAAITSTADPVPDGGNWAGAGRINMVKALKPAYRLGSPGTSRN